MIDHSDGVPGEAPLPRALAVLWEQQAPPRRSAGLTRDRIVAAAIELADADGLGALSMARLADRVGCGTMSLYRHVATKDELLVFMLSAAAAAPPSTRRASSWREALEGWADGLWEVYHRHPWILPTASAGPPADPGQLAWLDAGLATLGDTALSERDRYGVVTAVLSFVRGAAALAIDASPPPGASYSAVLRRVVDGGRFPALASAIEAGVFDTPDVDRMAEFRSGLARLLDGVAVRMASMPA